MAEKIAFPEYPPAEWDGERECVRFPAISGGRKISCRVSIELLINRFGARVGTGKPQGEAALQAFQKHRYRIQEAARIQILAGNISPNHEVVLTLDSFVFKAVEFAECVRQVPHDFQVLRQATADLEDNVGPSAGRATVKWDCTKDEAGRLQYLLQIQDEDDIVSEGFTPDQLKNGLDLRRRLLWLWGDLLQARNHKQLQELMAGSAEE
jgi:hypothetical protein